MSPARPTHNIDNEPEPKPYSTYFEYQRQLGDDKPNTVHDLPAQPASSPWGADPVPPEEPIDRREDGDFIQPTEGE
jgi:hypothetical protein